MSEIVVLITKAIDVGFDAGTANGLTDLNHFDTPLSCVPSSSNDDKNGKAALQWKKH